MITKETKKRGRPLGTKSTVLVKAFRLKELPDNLCVPIGTDFAKTLFGVQPEETFHEVLVEKEVENESTKPKVELTVEEYIPSS